MASRTISLPDDTMEFAEAAARRRGLGSVDAYLEAVLREERLREARREIDARLREAIESGPAEPMTREDWDAIEREGLARLDAERRGR
jgi:antitoxin ParD1/3/4